MRKNDYMSKWKMGIGSAFLIVMLSGCGSGLQDLASGAEDVSLVSADAADVSSNRSSTQALPSNANLEMDREQLQVQA
ncbi:hypothetical protein [Paenibacillus sp. TC-CSREp1]|uniref:hypothetical protein n=1 Tax=Paenibacillus sp. TC-CSREp1 TaxID=3410089 RepID=UPI003D079D51